jgi:hypothetical protein
MMVMPRAKRRQTVEEFDAAIDTVRARAEKEIAALQQKKTHIQASHFQRITRVARDAGCDLAGISDADLIAALKALALPFRGADAGPLRAAQHADQNPEVEVPHGKRRST